MEAKRGACLPDLAMALSNHASLLAEMGLAAGDKAGQWDAWHRTAIPLAEQRYEDYLQHEGSR